MNRAKAIIRVIKNVYYSIKYYMDSVNKKQTCLEVLECIDDAIRNKLNSTDILNGIFLGFIDLLNNISLLLYTELSQDQVKQFIFVCSAYIDEIMYNKIGEDKWGNYLMEYHFFGTKISGEKIITQILKFISQHSQQEKDYSIIYYLILCNGYTGIYRQKYDKIETLKKELFKLVSTEVLMVDSYDVNDISTSIYTHIIQTKYIDNIKNYHKIYFQTMLFILSIITLLILGVMYKGQIILKIL
ncbi:type VI secretion protein [uncultured bacterium]|nr:type VI secretion protein [uncultured bacterium]